MERRRQKYSPKTYRSVVSVKVLTDTNTSASNHELGRFTHLYIDTCMDLIPRRNCEYTLTMNILLEKRDILMVVSLSRARSLRRRRRLEKGRE